ncbi:Benzoate 4-monooxygenase, partial [Tolypocladium ophioglossoides CBS 100239]
MDIGKMDSMRSDRSFLQTLVSRAQVVGIALLAALLASVRDHVRYAPNRLIFNTAGALRDIYGHHGKVVKFKNYEILSRQAANLLTLRDKAQHGRRRRVISQAFSENSLRLFEPKILLKIDRFCEILRKRQDGTKISAEYS